MASQHFDPSEIPTSSSPSQALYASSVLHPSSPIANATPPTSPHPALTKPVFNDAWETVSQDSDETELNSDREVGPDDQVDFNLSKGQSSGWAYRMSLKDVSRERPKSIKPNLFGKEKEKEGRDLTVIKTSNGHQKRPREPARGYFKPAPPKVIKAVTDELAKDKTLPPLGNYKATPHPNPYSRSTRAARKRETQRVIDQLMTRNSSPVKRKVRQLTLQRPAVAPSLVPRSVGSLIGSVQTPGASQGNTSRTVPSISLIPPTRESTPQLSAPAPSNSPRPPTAGPQPATYSGIHSPNKEERMMAIIDFISKNGYSVSVHVARSAECMTMDCPHFGTANCAFIKVLREFFNM